MFSKLYTKVYTKTNYPNIFKGTYWGNLDTNLITHEIIQNRNQFIEDYDIKKSVILPRYCKVGMKFHTSLLEGYLTHDKKYVMLSSVFSKRYVRGYISDGWTPIYQLYGITTHSYVKIIPMRCRK